MYPASYIEVNASYIHIHKLACTY